MAYCQAVMTTKGKQMPETNDPIKPETIKDKKPLTAKAGKRSAKAVQEAETKAAKLEHKATNAAVDKPSKLPTAPSLHILKRSKAYTKISESIDKTKQYSIEEAASLISQTSPVKFDATIEAHIRLGVDPRQADQNVRDTVVLPAGTGKTVRVAVYVDDAAAKEAKEAGADLTGINELNKLFEGGKLDFDILITTPANMPKLSKYARILGPRGLMPNPKSGTVSPDITKAIAETKSGKVEYRVDSNGIIHLGIGKASFKAEQIQSNLQALLDSIKSNKPASIKTNYLQSVHLSTSMGPSIKLSV